MPDGKNAYVSVMDKGDLGTERIQTTTAKTSFAVDGIEAAVSANASYLAYTPGPKYESILSVKNLATGAISTIDLEPLLGSSTDLSNATITWLGDGSEIVVMPSGIATPVNASDSSSPTSGPTGGSNKRHVAHPYLERLFVSYSCTSRDRINLSPPGRSS